MNLKEEPCSILQGRGTMSEEAYITSTTFIPTMRLKKWKPKDSSPLVKGREYCYMDYDSNLTDYWFQWPNEQSCTQDMFDGYPVIADVFTDKKLDLTRSFPFKKCVIAVDKELATDKNLTSFWNKVSDIDCKSLYAWAQASNAMLKKEKDELEQYILQKRSEQSQLEKTIASKNSEIDGYNLKVNKLNNEIAQVKIANSHLTDSIKTTQAALNEANKKYGSIVTRCQSTVKDLTSAIKTIETETSEATKGLSNIQGSNALLSSEYNKLKVAYTTDMTAYSNVMDQNNQLLKLNSNLVAGIAKVTQDLTICNTNVDTVQKAYDTCKNDTNEQERYRKLYISQLDNCSSDLATCMTQYSTCSNNRSKLIDKNNKVIVLYQKCQDTYTACMGRQYDLISQSNTLQSNIDNWLRTHFICGSQVEALDSIKTSLNAQMSLCRVNDVAQYDQLLADSLKTVAQSSIDQVTACVADANTLFTSMPPKPQPPPIEPHPVITTTSRAVTCPPVYSAYLDEIKKGSCPANNSVGQEMCDRYLPGKEAKYVDNSAIPINNLRGAYICKYPGSQTDENTDNTAVENSSKQPPIFLLGQMRNLAVFERYQNKGNLPLLLFIITNPAWLTATKPGTGNNITYKTMKDPFGLSEDMKNVELAITKVVTGGSIPWSVSDDNKITCGSISDFDYSSCSNAVYGNISLIQGDNKDGAGNIDILSCTPTDHYAPLATRISLITCVGEGSERFTITYGTNVDIQNL